MPSNRRKLYPYHRSTFIQALAQVCTTDAEGEQIGLDKKGAQAFLEQLIDALHVMQQIVAEHDDDEPVEAAADLVDRWLAAMKAKRKKEK